MERSVFQYLRYANPPESLFPRRIRTALVYTMNVDAEVAQAMGISAHADKTRFFVEMVFGPCEVLNSYDTLQFDDYDKYDNSRFDPIAKMKRNREVFPQDEAMAMDLGRRLLNPIQ